MIKINTRNMRISVCAALVSSVLLGVVLNPALFPNRVGPQNGVAGQRLQGAFDLSNRQFDEIVQSIRYTFFQASSRMEAESTDMALPSGNEDKHSSPVQKENDELGCLALNIYHEARGEREAGQRAVGHVVMNRVSSSRFPSSICGVVHQGGSNRRNRCQFSWWCDGRADIPEDQKSWRRSLQIAGDIIAQRCSDPTGGALWYHADFVLPSWRKSFVRTAKIGQHIFYLAA